MTVTQIKKENFKKALKVLVDEFNAHNFDDETGGRKIAWVPNDQGDDIMVQIDRDSWVGVWDDKELEKKINDRINQVIQPITLA